MKQPDAEGLSLHDVTVPRPGSTTLREIWSRALQRTLLDVLTLRGASDTWPDTRAAVGRAAKQHPGAVFSVLREPGVGTRIRCLRDGSRGDIDRRAVTKDLEAALAHGLEEVWSGPPPRRAAFTSWRRRGRWLDGALQTDDAHGPLFVDLGAGVMLCRADDSPLALQEAHPDKDGNRTSLGGRSQAAWVQSLRDALAVVREGLPPLHDEIALALRQIVPVGFDGQRHLSASFRENLGTAYLSLHPAGMTMVEAVVHEFSHNKLNALLELDPLLNNAFEPLFSSPVRPDPRPLQGVLLAVHAFMAVEALYRTLRWGGHRGGVDFDRRLEAIAARNREGLQTLENAEPTPAGARVLDELRRLAAG